MKNNVNVQLCRPATWLSNQAYSLSGNSGKPPFASENYGHGHFEIRNDALVAHRNVGMRFVAGKTTYRTSSTNIMVRWANRLTTCEQSDYHTDGTALAAKIDKVSLLLDIEVIRIV